MQTATRKTACPKCGKTIAAAGLSDHLKRKHHGGMNAGGLVLSRRENEVVMIGDDIRVTVVDVRDGNVRLHFAAPPHVVIHREEVYLAIQCGEHSESEGETT